MEALLQVGDVVTRYVRAGNGPPVIVLFEDDAARRASVRLVQTLSRRWRVVIPELPVAGDVPSWLRDFADGLGVDRPGVVVVGRKPALGDLLRTLEPEQGGVFGRVVGVGGHPADAGWIEARMAVDDAVVAPRQERIDRR